MNSHRLCLALAALLAAPSAAPAQEKKEKGISNTVEFSFVDTSGNSKARTIRVADTLTLLRRPYALTARGGGYWSKFRDTTTAEWYNWDLRLDRTFFKRFYAYALGGWERNRFSGIEDRSQGHAGPGVLLLNTDKHRLRTEAGFGYFEEERTDKTIHNSPQARGGLSYTLKLSDTARVSEEFESVYNMDDPGDHRVRSVSALRVAINKYLGIRLSYTYLYRGKPISVFRKNDRIFSSGFYANF